MRDYRLYLDDILISIKKIERYTKNLSIKRFSENELVIDAVIRNLEIIGEASKNLSPRSQRNAKMLNGGKYQV